MDWGIFDIQYATIVFFACEAPNLLHCCIIGNTYPESSWKSNLN